MFFVKTAQKVCYVFVYYLHILYHFLGGLSTILCKHSLERFKMAFKPIFILLMILYRDMLKNRISLKWGLLNAHVFAI